MSRKIGIALLVLAVASFAGMAYAGSKAPQMGPYFKTDQGIMVRVLVRYDGQDRSPYLRQDVAGIAQKEAQQAGIRKSIVSLGGQVGYEFRHINVMSATIPLSRLTELSGMKGVVEITKDKIWEPHFDPFTASAEEKKAWVDQKSQALVERALQRRSDPNSIRKNAKIQIPLRADYAAQKENRKETRVGQPLRVGSGTLSSVSAGEVSSILSGGGVTPANYTFYNIGITNAAAIWNESQQGDGIIVGLIDSGSYSGHPLLSGTIIGSEVAPGLSAIEADFDLDGDGSPDGIAPPADSILNDPHGTGTACMIAGHGKITFPAGDRYLQAIEAHAPTSVVDNGDGTKSVLLFGSAPAASIYAIKVFPWYGGGSASSIIMAAMDRMISLRERYNLGRPGGMRIDVVNMSLGGPGLFPGFGVEDLLADSMVDVGIVIVISAGNAGPAPYTISEPGSALKAITVGAAAEPRHNRIAFEFGFPQLPVGGGVDMVPSARTQIVDFSSRGPLATGYAKPDVVAEGANCMTAWMFDTDGDGLNDLADVAIVGGTSFSAPTTAGGAALLTKMGMNLGLPLTGQPIKAALMRTARRLNGSQPHMQGMGFVDFEAAAAFWKANPGVIAGRLNKQKMKFTGETYGFIDVGLLAIAYGSTDPLEPGEQSDFLLPMETSSADQPYLSYFYVAGTNKQRAKPFPAVVRSIFDPDPTDAVPPYAALLQNTEVYYADGINTGFSDGDYILSSLNQVDTSYFVGPAAPFGAGIWYPDFFPALTVAAVQNPGGGYIQDVFGGPITNLPSSYAQGNSHQQMGSGGFADFDRFTFLGDQTNESGSPVRAFMLWQIFRRSLFGLTTGTPSLSGTIAQNQVKQFTVNLPTPSGFYSFHNSFDMGWNNYKFAPPSSGEIPWKSKRKVADVDFLVESPSGLLLNSDGFPGFFQGATLNDVEMIHDVASLESGQYTITVIGFDVKRVPFNRTNWAVRIWDDFVPIIP